MRTLPLAVCLVLQFHFHDNIPWQFWFVALAIAWFAPNEK